MFFYMQVYVFSDLTSDPTVAETSHGYGPGRGVAQFVGDARGQI